MSNVLKVWSIDIDHEVSISPEEMGKPTQNKRLKKGCTDNRQHYLDLQDNWILEIQKVQDNNQLLDFARL